MQKYHTIFFDVGNTLVTAKPSVGQVYCEIAAKFDIIADPEEIEKAARAAFMHLSGEARRTGAESPHSISLEAARSWWRRVVRASFGEAANSPRFEAFYQTVFDEFAKPERYQTFPEVHDVLGDLIASGHRLGIISNWDPRLRPILEGHRLTEKFSTIIISGEVGVEKPHSEIYDRARQMALQQHPHTGGNSGFARFLMIGDSPLDDIEGAEAAGFDARLIERSSHQSLRELLKDLL